IVFTLFMPGFYEHASERFSALDEETASDTASRHTTWLYTMRIIAEHPIGGIGFGEQQFLRELEAVGFAAEYGRLFDNPHNSYLQAAVYAGIPALGAFLLANAVLLSLAVRVCRRSTAVEQTSVVFGLAVGVAGFLACIYPDMHLFTQTVAPVYWVFFGLLLSMVSRAPEANRYENRHPYFRNSRQHLARQSTPGTA
ncbi:MAG: O-antigen ligase family protein, partial [bacterium]